VAQYYFSDQHKPDPDSVMMYWGLQRFVIIPLPGGIRLPEQPNTAVSAIDEHLAGQKYGRRVTGPVQPGTAGSARSGLKAADAVALPVDGAALEKEFASDEDLHLYKIDVTAGNRHVIETIENSGAGITLELFSGTDFSVGKWAKVSKPGDGITVLDGYLEEQLNPGTHYIIARHNHFRGRGKYKIAARRAVGIPNGEAGTWRRLKRDIAASQDATQEELEVLDQRVKQLKAVFPR
jgi:hypothetical protein